MDFSTAESIVLCLIASIMTLAFTASIGYWDYYVPRHMTGAAAAAAGSTGNAGLTKLTDQSLQWWMRRIGLVTAIELIVLGVDQSGGNGIYSIEVVQLLVFIMDSLLAVATGCWIVFTTRGLFRLLNRDLPNAVPYAITAVYTQFAACFVFGYSFYFTNRAFKWGVLLAEASVLVLLIGYVLMMLVLYITLRNQLRHVMTRTVPIHVRGPSLYAASPLLATATAPVTATVVVAVTPTTAEVALAGGTLTNPSPLTTPVSPPTAGAVAAAFSSPPPPATATPTVVVAVESHATPAPAAAAAAAAKGGALSYSHVISRLNKFFVQVLVVQILGLITSSVFLYGNTMRIIDPSLIDAQLRVRPGFQLDRNLPQYASWAFNIMTFSIANPF